MQIELSSKQIERLINMVGVELDATREAFLLRLYLRLVTQAHEQGIDICAVQSVEANDPS